MSEKPTLGDLLHALATDAIDTLSRAEGTNPQNTRAAINSGLCLLVDLNLPRPEAAMDEGARAEIAATSLGASWQIAQLLLIRKSIDHVLTEGIRLHDEAQLRSAIKLAPLSDSRN